jgi:hypothetical protein
MLAGLLSRSMNPPPRTKLGGKPRKSQAAAGVLKKTKAMPRFFFHVFGSQAFLDPEGTDLQSLDEARKEALQDARALMSEAILGGHDISGRRIKISNDAGEMLSIFNFADAIKSRE